MNIQRSRKLNEVGSALLVVMILGGMLCVFVMYYLSLIQQQNTLSVRSQAWNLAMAVTEAGIEEGLQALNSTGTPQESDGWLHSGGIYWRSNTLPDGSYYWVTNDLSTPTVPAVTARSFVRLPALASAPGATMIAAANVNAGGTLLVSRAVKVTCKKNPTSLFTAAMVAKHVIDLKGNGVATDSYDSSNPAKSTNGQYDSSKYTGDSGDVASNDGLIVGVQNANIYGKLHTGAGGSYSMGPNGGVGTHAWQAANGGGMQTGYFLQDANFTFPDTSLPDTTGYLTPQALNIVFPTNSVIPSFHTEYHSWDLPSPLPDGLVTNYNKKGVVINYTWTTYTTNVYYVTNRLYDNVLEAYHNYVCPSGLVGTTIVQGPNVKLVLPDGLTGREKFFFNYTDNANPGVTVYAGGTSASISGNQYVNPSGFAGSLIIYCAPSVTSFVLNGNGQFTGVLVAPNADLAMNGGGNSDMDFCGSLMVNNVKLNGHFKFHWDEALAGLKSDNDARYLVESWNEIP